MTQTAEREAIFDGWLCANGLAALSKANRPKGATEVLRWQEARYRAYETRGKIEQAQFMLAKLVGEYPPP